jgi:hypothetical protein
MPDWRLVMADMIDAKEAKNLLGCDDAALNGHINGGAIRAQRVGGKLMLNKDDVMKLKDDDGTIVLTGDSDELNIDLGKVVDDASETIVQPRRDASGSATESITFGDELEVVSFDDGNTKDLNHDKTKATSSGLSFTDSNTAVMTAVDETQVGGTTGPVEFSTSQVESQGGPAGSASRRSVRSNRARVEAPKVHWAWSLVMAVTVIVGAAFTLPYYFIALMPHSSETLEKDAAGNVLRGLDDNGWTNMAAGSPWVKFSVDPDKARHARNHPDGGEWIDIAAERDRQAKWRRDEYLGGKATKQGERLDHFIVTEVSEDGKAKTKGGQTFSVTETKVEMQDQKGAINEKHLDLGFPK